jgi:hypothetical protein
VDFFNQTDIIFPFLSGNEYAENKKNIRYDKGSIAEAEDPKVCCGAVHFSSGNKHVKIYIGPYIYDAQQYKQDRSSNNKRPIKSVK